MRSALIENCEMIGMQKLFIGIYRSEQLVASEEGCSVMGQQSELVYVQQWVNLLSKQLVY